MLRLNEYDVVKSVCRESFYDFVREFWSTIIPERFVYNWHIEYICGEVQRVVERVFAARAKEYDLVINVPPGTTKSTIVSVMLVPWTWIRMPSFRWICASHSADLGRNLSRLSRDVVMSELYAKCFPYVQLRKDQQAKGYFVTTAGGGRLVATVGGRSPTGFHAHGISVDDPIDPRKAGSMSERELINANTWMTETLPTRKVDKAVTPTILVMQRLHQNDPSANMLARGGNRHICLPAEITDDVTPVPLKARYVDGLLDPKRLSPAVLNGFKMQSQYAYSSQFLQSPIPRGGGMFKVDRVEIHGEAPKMLRTVRYWDKAGTSKGGCFTVGVKMGVDADGRFWVLDVVRDQWDSDARERTIKQTAEMDGREVKIGVETEPGSGGKESAQGTARRLAGYVVKLDRPTGDKEWRADPYSAQVNAGNVALVRGDWNEQYLQELRYFPYSTYKDQVDASSGAFAMLVRTKVQVGAF